jgi:hypothetical protein
VSQFHDSMVDSLRKEPKDINHSLMLLTRVSEAHFSIMQQLAVMRSYVEKHL